MARVPGGARDEEVNKDARNDEDTEEGVTDVSDSFSGLLANLM